MLHDFFLRIISTYLRVSGRYNKNNNDIVKLMSLNQRFYYWNPLYFY